MEWPLIGREADLDQVAALVEAGTGIAILGPAGVGKSRLLHELVDRAGAGGKTVVRAVASQSTRSIPFAPFVDLLPEGPTGDRLTMLMGARQALKDMSGQKGVLISVDDAHHLDEMSLAFLVGAVGLDDVAVAMTVRAGEPLEPDLVDLWTNGVIARFDLGPLERNRARQLAEAILGALSPELEEELWRLAQGNPLVLHELIEGARGTAIAEGEDGIWLLAGAVTESARLADLVASRLRALPGEVSGAMSVVALGAPLPFSVASAVFGDTLGDLEDRGLIARSGSSHGFLIRPVHPMYGEILAANLSESRRRQVYGSLIEASVETGNGVDVLQAAIWQHYSGRLISPELALAGAEHALIRHDPGLAEALVRPVGGEVERAILVRGRALSYQQRFVEAEEMLSRKRLDGSAVSGEMASIRAQNLGFGLGRVAEARDILETAASRNEDPGMRARLNNERAMISAIAGDFADARVAADAVLSDEGSNGVSRTSAYVTLSIALAMTGDVSTMDGIVEEALKSAEAHVADLPFARDQIEIMNMCSMLNSGRVDDAIELTRTSLVPRGRGDAMRSTWLSARCLALELAGLLEEAADTAGEAIELFGQADPFGLEAQSRGYMALTLGQMGDETAGEWIDGLTLPIDSPRLSVWVDRGRVWSAVVSGDIDRAVDIAIAGGQQAVAGEHFVWGALCFHDAVRLGHPEFVLEDLRAIDSTRGALLVTALIAHAEALADSDSVGLADVAFRFGDMGACLLAAEAWAQTAGLLIRAGHEIEAARACARSISYELRCESPDTPALRERPNLISMREMEVAGDAVGGMTGPQISAKRFISVRTVDNHLSSVYRKLQAAGRDELAEVLNASAKLGRNRVLNE